MRKIYCDCCKREILSVEQLFSMEIKKGQDAEIILNDMCANCYERIMHVINNAEMWMLVDKSSVLWEVKVMYINRKDALEILKKLSREPYYQHDGEDYYAGIAEATGEIYSMLPADVVPIIHAEWVKKDGLYCCSHCDSVCPYDVQADVIEYWECFYCPKCGAIMNK